MNVERWANGLLVIRKDRYTARKRDKGEKVAKVGYMRRAKEQT